MTAHATRFRTSRQALSNPLCLLRLGLVYPADPSSYRRTTRTALHASSTEYLDSPSSLSQGFQISRDSLPFLFHDYVVFCANNLHPLSPFLSLILPGYHRCQPEASAPTSAAYILAIPHSQRKLLYLLDRKPFTLINLLTSSTCAHLTGRLGDLSESNASACTGTCTAIKPWVSHLEPERPIPFHSC